MGFRLNNIISKPNNPPTLPYPNPVAVPSKFNRVTTIFPDNWDKKGKYSFSVIKGGAIGKDAPGWNELFLNISPQDITISNTIPTQLTPTSRGIIEEFGHIMISDINIVGTTGVLPTRDSIAQADQGGVFGQVVSKLFAGTIQAAQNTATAAKKLFSSAGNSNAPSTLSDAKLKETGYYQLEQLQNYLLKYTDLKITDPTLRLLFKDYKRGKIYTCSLSRFATKKSAANPMYITYTIQLRAWKVVDEGAGVTIEQFPNGNPKTNILSTVFNKLQQARSLLASTNSIVSAIRSDAEQSLFEPLRQIALTGKDALAIEKSLVDLPNDLASSFNVYVTQNFQNLKNDANNSALVAFLTQHQDVFQNGDSSAIGALFTPSVIKSQFAAFDSIKVSGIPLDPSQTKALSNIDDKTTNLNTADFDNMKASLQSVIKSIEDAVGLGDGAGFRPANFDDLSILGALNDSIIAADAFSPINGVKDKISMHDAVQNVIQLYTDGTETLLDAAPLGAKLVPVPYGFNMKEIASLYLDDPDKDLDIITLNALSPPYIDEVGTVVKLVTNAALDTIIIPNTAQVYIGQKIEIFSNTVPLEKRQILQSIVQGSNIQLTLSGGDPLDNLLLSDNASIRYYAPNTINSGTYMLIPVDSTPATTNSAPDARKVYATADLDLVDKIMGVDILTDSTGDIVILPQGDIKYATGVTAGLQALRTLIGTSLDSYMRHKEYGAGLSLGSSNAEVTAKEIQLSIKQNILSDPRFASINDLSINLMGSALIVNVSVNLANGSGIVSTSFTIN